MYNTCHQLWTMASQARKDNIQLPLRDFMLPHRSVNEIFALLVCYAAQTGSNDRRFEKIYLPALRHIAEDRRFLTITLLPTQ
jgi:hypothetical protein